MEPEDIVALVPVMGVWLQNTHWCGHPIWGTKMGMIEGL